jgi:coenzyme F420 hydrogenase subunit beta
MKTQKIAVNIIKENDLCVGCGVCAAICPTSAIEMQWSPKGFLEPTQAGDCGAHSECLTVCPFNPEPLGDQWSETWLREYALGGKVAADSRVGQIMNSYVGSSREFRGTGSSGGIATLIATELIAIGEVTHVALVHDQPNLEGGIGYTLCSNREEVIAGARTKYHPVTLATVLRQIRNSDMKVAIVAVGCFVKAIRLAQLQDETLYRKVPFIIGIICGGLKSRYFTEYLAERAGVPRRGYDLPRYREKTNSKSASDYYFTCIDTATDSLRQLSMSSVGDMWGSGLFKANACDYCDDVTTELADVSVGDAWIHPFVSDPAGTSIVLTRSEAAEKVIQDLIRSGRAQLETLSVTQLHESQRGSFSHRQDDLVLRLAGARSRGMRVPPKREYKTIKPTLYRWLVQYLRASLRKQSLKEWAQDLSVSSFDRRINFKRRALVYLSMTRNYSRIIRKKLRNRIRK